MAESSSSSSSKTKFFCELCQLGFHFASKYHAHLGSSNHKALQEIFNIKLPPEITKEAGATQGALVGTEETLDVSAVDSVSPCESPIPDFESDPPVMEATTLLSDHLPESCSEDELETSELEALLSILPEGNDYSPFRTKIHALAYMLMHSPRPMGEANLKFIFFIMRQLDSTVPSISAMKSVCLPGFTPPTQHYSSGGLPFYVNSVKEIIRRCIGNPNIASVIARYPTIPDDIVTEMFHGARWLEDPRFFSPMAHTSDGCVFVKDFVRFHFGGALRLGRISFFFCKEGITGVCARIQCLQPDGLGIYAMGDEVSIPTTSITVRVQPPLAIRHRNTSLLLTTEEYNSYTSPHPSKATAEDRPVVMLLLILYTDDTSGNKSKQWNKFDSWCLKLAGLPNKDNQDLQNIHLICSSNKVDSIEMTPPLVEELKLLESDGMQAFDAFLQKTVLVIAPVICIICDNPRASEVTNNLGPGSKMFCRICMTDRNGDTASLGELRTKDRTLQQIGLIRSQRTGRQKAALRTQYGVNDISNSLLEFPLDLHRSTPVETSTLFY